MARPHSANPDDAEGAVQRGLEIYARWLGRVDPATELAWLGVDRGGSAGRRASAGAPSPIDPDSVITTLANMAARVSPG